MPLQKYVPEKQRKENNLAYQIKIAPGPTSWATGAFFASGFIVASAFSFKKMKSLIDIGDSCQATGFGIDGVVTLFLSIFIMSLLAMRDHDKSQAYQKLG